MTQPCRDQRDLYRQQYRQGQMLRSRDLADQVEDEEQLRWWHNRAVHHAYGIAYGFEAKKTSGGTAIIVSAGLAYDSFGRPLQLTSSVTKRVPLSLQGEHVLFVSKAPNDEHIGGRHSEGAWCETPIENGAPTVEWKPTREFSVRDGVSIATVDLQPKGAIKKLTRVNEYRTRPDRNPYLINGQTILGQTAWEVWKESLSRNFIIWGVQVTIDTRAAGFTGEPMYVAQTAPFVGPFTSYVTSLSEVGFTFRIAIEHNASELVFLESAAGLEWLSRLRQFVAVKWIGFELMAEELERTR
jgi:hypothetical protein